MTSELVRQNRAAAYRLVALQAVVCIIAAVFGLIAGRPEGFSLLVGGLIAVLPNLLFATLAFAKAGASAARQIQKAFYLGETLKWLLTIVLFVLVYLFLKVLPAWLVTGFTLCVLVQLAAPFIVKPSY